MSRKQHTANPLIRNTINQNNLRHWEVAEAMGISDAYFSKLMRRQLPGDMESKVLAVIDDIARMKGA